MRGLYPWASFLRELVLPARCALCSGALLSPAEAHRGLCRPCARALPVEPGPRCPRCGRPLISERNCCMECRVLQPPPYDGALALYRYGGAARTLLSSYKFGPCRAAGRFLADRLLEGADSLVSQYGRVDALVPVPPRPGKLRSRGWDQVEYLARSMESRTPVPVRRCLRRLASRSQKELNRAERSVNLRGRILCTGCPGERVVLFDDVVTTGATFRACAEALASSGVRSVLVLALFYD